MIYARCRSSSWVIQDVGSRPCSRMLRRVFHMITTNLSSRLSQGQHAPKVPGPLPTLHDLDQPFIFDISMYNRPYRFEFYDTASPENFTLLQPDFVILCFDITDRRSLINVPQVWRKNVTRYYRRDGEDPPLMVLGLKRDARVEEEGVIYPQEVYYSIAGLECAAG